MVQFRPLLANQIIDLSNILNLFSKVLDYDRFEAGKLPSEGFLTVLEEVPGLVHYEDLTQQLNVRVETSFRSSGGKLLIEILRYNNNLHAMFLLINNHLTICIPLTIYRAINFK